ncbi:TPM domain-containing protein, partial [Clostridium perfringens]
MLTDALSSVIINQDMMPKLKAGDIAGAMTAGTDALIQQLSANPEEAKARTDAAIKKFDATHRRSTGSRGGG